MVLKESKEKNSPPGFCEEGEAMNRRDITKIDVKYKNQRDVVQNVKDFIDSEKCYDGNILVLYGLRRTGKTTIMEQAIEHYKDKEKCAFFEVDKGDTLDDVKRCIIEESKNGTTIICFDEITKANDFITNSAAIADVFAKEGMRILVTGTDSLGFHFADGSELYDRTVRVNTTHISFAEHCRVLNTKDIDDYIQYGGLMKKGEKEARIIHDYESACKYLDSAVAENISRSIQRNPEDNCLEVLNLSELKTIIEKMVERYSGVFSKKIMQEELKKVSVNSPVDKLSGIVDAEIIYKLTMESKNITRDFVQMINADTAIKHTITDEIVLTLEKCLLDMNLLSVTPQMEYYYTDETGWLERGTRHEYYIIQPAIKYYHLQKGKEFIENEDYYKDLSSIEKKFMQDKLDEKIKGDMTEQIIIFDVSKDLPRNKYSVLKPVFYIDGQRKGEYDMLIYDKEKDRYWGFEVKHTTSPHHLQAKHLQNERFKEILDAKYGDKENVAILYRGESFTTPTKTLYLNITEFMLAIDKYHDMDKVMEELIENLPVRAVTEDEIYEPQHGRPEQYERKNQRRGR